jgi:hypothetical protein
MSSSSRAASRVAAAFGALALVAIPAGVLAAQFLAGVSLLRALYVTVAASVVCGLVAYLAARRARLARARSIDPEQAGRGRWGQLLAWAGLYVGVTGALALGVYGVLRWAQ